MSVFRIAVVSERSRRRMRLEKQIGEMYDEDLRLGEIARELGLHPDHVSRVLKRVKRARSEARALSDGVE